MLHIVLIFLVILVSEIPILSKLVFVIPNKYSRSSIFLLREHAVLMWNRDKDELAFIWNFFYIVILNLIFFSYNWNKDTLYKHWQNNENNDI